MSDRSKELLQSLPASLVSLLDTPNPNVDSDHEDFPEQEETKTLSRHAASVSSHFTSSAQAYARLVAELDDFLHVVDDEGKVVFASASIMKTLGYTPEEILNRPVTELVHQNDIELVKSHIQNPKTGFYSRYIGKRGNIVVLHVNVTHFERGNAKLILLAGREYRSKGTLAIDSVLELKLENVRLKRQLERLLLENPTVQITDPSLSPVIIPPIPLLSPNHWSADSSKKKTRIASDELFCRQCGTTSSPEWRKGPEGSKTLCNACGLAYSKKQRKKNDL